MPDLSADAETFPKPVDPAKAALAEVRAEKEPTPEIPEGHVEVKVRGEVYVLPKPEYYSLDMWAAATDDGKSIQLTQLMLGEFQWRQLATRVKPPKTMDAITELWNAYNEAVGVPNS